MDAEKLRLQKNYIAKDQESTDSKSSPNAPAFLVGNDNRNQTMEKNNKEKMIFPLWLRPLRHLSYASSLQRS